MRRAILLHREGRTAPERRELEGPSTAGGSRADTLLLPELPPGALHLEPCAAGVVIAAAAAGVRVGGRKLRPGDRRLLRPGERAVIRGFALALPEEPGPRGGTRVVAASLLRRCSDGAAPPAGPHLVVLTGPAAGERLPLGPEQTLGRSRRAGVRIEDPAASRLHARLRIGPGGATVADLGARNRLLVNGIPLGRGERALRAGDELQLGDTALALVVPGAPAALPPHAPLPSATWEAPPPARGADARRAAAALLALSAIALALAGR